MIISDDGLLTWTATEGVLTSGLVTLTVSDGDLSSQEFFEIIVTQVNDVPVITSLAPTTATEDIEYIYQISVEDPDNDSFTYTLDNAPDGMIVTPSGLVSWTALEGVTTSGVVTLTVSDGDLTAVEEFEITVTQVNDAPVIALSLIHI